MVRILWRFWLRYWRLGRLLLLVALVTFVVWWLVGRTVQTAKLMQEATSSVTPEDPALEVRHSQTVAFAVVADLIMYAALLIATVCLSAAYALVLLRQPIAWSEGRTRATNKPKSKGKAVASEPEVTRYYIDPSGA